MNTLTLPQVLERINALEASMESVRITAAELRQWKLAVQQAIAKTPESAPSFPAYSHTNLPQLGHIVRVVCSYEGDTMGTNATGRVCEMSSTPWIHAHQMTRYPHAVKQFNIPAGYAGCMSMHKLQRIA